LYFFSGNKTLSMMQKKGKVQGQTPFQRLVQNASESLMNSISMNERNYVLFPLNFEVQLTFRKAEKFDLK
jgi:hypothetical protein